MLRHFFYDNVCEVVVEMAEPQKNQEDGTKLCVISKYHEDFFFFFFRKEDLGICTDQWTGGWSFLICH